MQKYWTPLNRSKDNAFSLEIIYIYQFICSILLRPCQLIYDCHKSSAHLKITDISYSPADLFPFSGSRNFFGVHSQNGRLHPGGGTLNEVDSNLHCICKVASSQSSWWSSWKVLKKQVVFLIVYVPKWKGGKICWGHQKNQNSYKDIHEFLSAFQSFTSEGLCHANIHKKTCIQLFTHNFLSSHVREYGNNYQ